ncbi:MAG: hypothetical protein AAFU71_11040 [Cyanobacteria bacterium J06632_22]
MSSPFSTLEEFNGAIDGPTGGAIYTFAGSPSINAIALLVSVGLFLWFMVKTYTTAHPETPTTMDKSISHLSSFIVAGLLSLVAADQLQPPTGQEQVRRRTQRTTLIGAAQRAPLALLGMVGIGLPTRRARRRRYRNLGSPKR